MIQWQMAKACQCLENYTVKFISDISFTQEQQDPEVKQWHSKRKHLCRWRLLHSSASRAYTHSCSSGAGRREGDRESREANKERATITAEGDEGDQGNSSLLLLPKGLKSSLQSFLSDIWKVLQSSIDLGSVWPLNVTFQPEFKPWESEMFTWEVTKSDSSYCQRDPLEGEKH